jgi:Flp pilus assembly protein TadB
MLITILMFSLLALLLIAWVLHINANDRKQFEKELEEELAGDSEDRS